MSEARLPHDPVLPQLARALDTRYMHRALQAYLDAGSGGGFQIRDLRIERIKYKPGKNCLVCYGVEGFDGTSGRRTSQWLSGRIYERGGSLSRYRKARRDAPAAGTVVPPLLHLQSMDMVAWAFPNERKLEALPVIVDRDTLGRTLLPPLVHTRFGPDWRIADFQHLVAHYAPEYSCSVRVTMQLENVSSGTRRQWTVYGKTYYNDRGAETYRTTHLLWQSAARRRGTVRIPRPLAYSSHLRLLWQEGLPGITVPEHAGDGAQHVAFIHDAGRMVAALHAVPLNCSKRIDSKDAIECLERTAQLLTHAWPSCREPLQRVVRRLSGLASKLDLRTNATLHGDLHPKNLLVDCAANAGERVALIDLDTLANGPPAYDLGSWAASVMNTNLLSASDESVAVHRVQNFFDAYHDGAPARTPSLDLRWYTAAALINERAFRCLTRLKKGRLELLDELVALAERVADGRVLEG